MSKTSQVWSSVRVWICHCYSKIADVFASILGHGNHDFCITGQPNRYLFSIITVNFSQYDHASSTEGINALI